MAVICRAAAAQGVEHHIVHTGQHYDAEMSDVFFQELDIPAPDHHLGVGSGSHGAQTGEMLKRIEPVLEAERPDWVLLYGDTNSTLAGAVVASKMGLRVAHVEAGLRSFNRCMPEELNRIVTDHLSDLLLCPTPLAVHNLGKEGLADRAILTGDVMYDAVLAYRERAEREADSGVQTWRAGEFALATVHRAENTDDLRRLGEIVEALESVAREICPVVWPVHPRTKKSLEAIGWKPHAVTLIPPVGYLGMILLESRARCIFTDSGGVQKEAYFVHVPCITLRDETEWQETLGNNCNVLAGTRSKRIVAAAQNAGQAGPWVEMYGDGKAGIAILKALVANRTLLRAGPSGIGHITDSELA
jgi:UDP-GlcNAc3NAcA epimerase